MFDAATIHFKIRIDLPEKLSTFHKIERAIKSRNCPSKRNPTKRKIKYTDGTFVERKKKSRSLQEELKSLQLFYCMNKRAEEIIDAFIMEVGLNDFQATKLSTLQISHLSWQLRDLPVPATPRELMAALTVRAMELENTAK